MRDLALLPKAHLHVHLDGALRRSTYVELAEKHGSPAPLPTSFSSFAAFGEIVAASAALLDGEETLARVLDELLADADAEGVVWLELSVWPGLFAGRLGDDEAAVDAVLSAGRQASARHGAALALIVAANRERGPDEALCLARLAGERADHGVCGFGLDGDEATYPPGPFAAAFALARHAGLVAVPHAGELAGPECIASALDLLGAHRIMHGVRAAESPGLVERLATEGICLDVCPTSNVALDVVTSLSAHPLPSLLAAGVHCSLNADDPLPFNVSILDEYERAREEMGLSDEQLADVARTSLRCSAAPPRLVETSLAAVDDWLAGSP
jgi:adenosine deaminase